MPVLWPLAVSVRSLDRSVQRVEDVDRVVDHGFAVAAPLDPPGGIEVRAAFVDAICEQLLDNSFLALPDTQAVEQQGGDFTQCDGNVASPKRIQQQCRVIVEPPLVGVQTMKRERELDLSERSKAPSAGISSR